MGTVDFINYCLGSKEHILHKVGGYVGTVGLIYYSF